MIAPSILAANPLRLGDALQEVAAAPLIHLDIMDGHFVPNLSFGPATGRAVAQATDQFVEAHLMCEDSSLYLDAWVATGVQRLIVHAEAVRHLERTIALIHDHGLQCGVALNPASPLALVEEIFPELDLLLLMTVNPGFGGQRFLPQVLGKIERAKAMRNARAAPLIEVDGGIDLSTLPLAARAGAQVFVAGSAIFGSPSPRDALQELTHCEKEHL